MTIKELYEFAVKEGIENYEITVCEHDYSFKDIDISNVSVHNETKTIVLE